MSQLVFGVVTALTVILGGISETFGQDTWEPPYFSDPQTPGVRLESVINNYNYIFHAQEEIPAPFVLAIINYSNRNNRPVISNYLLGDRNILNATVEQSSDSWQIVINHKLDYEAITFEYFSFELYIQGIEIISPFPPRISLNIDNIFDNEPQFSSDQRICKVKELSGTNFDTDCFYVVYDPDGLDGNEFTFTINGSEREHEKFEFIQVGRESDIRMRYRLRVKEELQFIEREMYSFIVEVSDIAGNKGSANVIVEVEDVPNMPPRWTQPFATAAFDEKSEPQKFTVAAIDGDTQIKDQIFYELRFDPVAEWNANLQIDRSTGELLITSLDRDDLKQEVFNFRIRAFESMNESSFIENPASIILNDLNDNLPMITLGPQEIHIYEETFETLAFTTFVINDIDLGANAQYSVELIDVDAGTEDYAAALVIIPNAGYQETNFLISVVQADLLDFERVREFRIKIKATEDIEPTRFQEQEFLLVLKNWNDELPIFSQQSYEVELPENIVAGARLGAVLAADRDVDDKIEYFIVGYMSGLIDIYENGEMFAKDDDFLDYERQPSVVVQVGVRDTLETDKPGETIHTVYTQLIIVVQDINDETPVLRMPRETPSVEENSAVDTLVTDLIIARDPDTSAALEFEIVWASSYASKNGQSVDVDEIRDCFSIQTDSTNMNEVIGNLVVSGPIDYELTEVIYLMIKVTDRAQEINEESAESILTVRIIDRNDNAPEFIEGTLGLNRTVLERSLENAIIGTVTAVDADGPQFNKVIYAIEPVDFNEEWVHIHPDTGVLTVAVDRTIDCDDPEIFYLNYIVTAHNEELFTDGVLAIYIIDTNDKIPEFDDMPEEIEVYENVESAQILQITATDKDRDEQNRRLDFQLDLNRNPEQFDLFTIDRETGWVSVRTQSGFVLDRDGEFPTHTITVVVSDNYLGQGTQNSNSMYFVVKLLDVNDNAPVLPGRGDFNPSVSEDITVPTVLSPTLVATDKDEPNTASSQVSFRILSISPLTETANPPPDPMEVFEIESNRLTNTGTVRITGSLKGFYGTWQMLIEAYDHGDEIDNMQRLSSQEEYLIMVNPFNYEAPQIVFPDKANPVLRLRYLNLQLNDQLYLYSNQPLPNFEAFDPDGGSFGKVEFSIVDSSDSRFFKLEKIDDKRAQLQIVEQIEDRTYHIHIRASDGEKIDDIQELRVVFIDSNSYPKFNIPTWETNMIENDQTVKVQVPAAEDSKNELLGEDELPYPIFYFLDGSASNIFTIEMETGVLGLARELDRETEPTLEIVVYAAGNSDGVANNDPSTRLTITVNVDDVNDCAPYFLDSEYGVGITSTDNVGKNLFKVAAEDEDLEDVITFSIVSGSITASDGSIQGVKDTAFQIDPNDGWVSLRFKPQENHKGHFMFHIQAQDSANPPHETNVDAIIYIIADSNRVLFEFENTVDQVEAQRTFIAETIGKHFGFDCFIDDVEPLMREGLPSDIETQANLHFVKDNIAIEGNVIEVRSNDDDIVSLMVALRTQEIILQKVRTDGLTTTSSNLESLYRTLLIVVSVVMGIMCVLLIIAFLIRTRSLNRQLKAFSTTDFGSTASNLNRREAPTTNVFSVEGSNPVLHNEIRRGAFDEESVQSDDSDFIGFEDHHPGLKQNGVTIGNGDIEKRESVNVSKVNGMRSSNNQLMDLDNDSLTRF